MEAFFAISSQCFCCIVLFWFSIPILMFTYHSKASGLIMVFRPYVDISTLIWTFSVLFQLLFFLLCHCWTEVSEAILDFSFFFFQQSKGSQGFHNHSCKVSATEGWEGHFRCLDGWRNKLSNTFIHWFIHSFIHSVIHLFMHSCMHSFMHAFIHSFIDFSHSFIYSLIHSFIHSFIHSLIPSLLHSSIHSLIHSFIHWLVSFIHSFIH